MIKKYHVSKNLFDEQFPKWTEIPYKRYETSTDTLTTLPAEVIADGNNATVGLVGNMSQTGTPSPSSIVIPQDCGDKTGNLCDEDNLNQGYYNTSPPFTFNGDNRYRCFSLNLTAGTYSILVYGSNIPMRLLRVSSNSLGIGYVSTDNEPYTFDLTVSETVYITFRNTNTSTDFTGLTVMMNAGNTVLPYEPYGYKIPILSGDTTTNVYLGEVQSTRQIKKLVLTGEESWASFEQSGVSLYRCANNLLGKISGSPIDTMLCTVLRTVGSRGDCATTSNSMSVYNIQNDSRPVVNVNPMTLSEWTTFIQQQYAAGTPVCVWYVLAEPTTAIVNEPLRKIGDYADTVSGISVPTLGTSEQFDVDTTLKPSEVSLAYTGWHNKSDTKF